MSSSTRIIKEKMADSPVIVSRNSEITEQAQRLLRTAAPALRQCVRCEFHEGVLILRGTVPSYYLKQLAQTVTRTVTGVELVVNQLAVVIPERRSNG